MNYFNPSVILKSDITGTIWSLGVKNGKLAIVPLNKHQGTHVLKRADQYTIVERTPVTGWLTGVILDLWTQFAHEDGKGGRNSGGLSALEAAEDALRTAGLIDENGRPRKALTLPAGAGGMVPEKDGEECQ